MTADDILNNAMFAGEIMLSNGAETNRVEDTMLRILMACGETKIETFTTLTGVFASIDTEKYGLKTAVKRIKTRRIHLGKVAMVNDLSRRLTDGEIPIENLYGELLRINEYREYPATLRVFFAGIACGCFAYMFGGDVISALNAMVIGWLSNSAVTYFSTKDVSGVLTNLAGSAFLTFLALLALSLGLNSEAYLDETIIGAIMPMVPGIALTNAIRDILEGDFLSGSARITDAVLVAISIASGVGFALMTWPYFLAIL